MEIVGKVGAGLAVVGATFAGLADKPPIEAPAHVSFNVVHDTEYDTLDGLIGCIVTVEGIQQEDVGAQVVPSEDCPPDPNAIGSTALNQLGHTAGTVYERTDTGVVETTPGLPAVREALEGAKNDLAANRARKFGRGLFGLGALGIVADFVRGRRGANHSAPANPPRTTPPAAANPPTGSTPPRRQGPGSGRRPAARRSTP